MERSDPDEDQREEERRKEERRRQDEIDEERRKADEERRRRDEEEKKKDGRNLLGTIFSFERIARKTTTLLKNPVRNPLASVRMNLVATRIPV